MKVKKFKLLEICILICILINTYFTYFIGIALTSPFRITNIFILGMIAVLNLAVVQNSEYKKIIDKVTPFFIVFIFCLVIEIIYSVIRYSQTFMEVLVCWQPYMYLFLVFPLIYVFLKDKREKFIKIIAIIVAIGILLRLVQAVAYNSNSTVIFPTLMEYGVVGIRNNKIRLSVTNLGYVSTIVIFYQIICKKKAKIGYFLLLISNLVAYVYMSQSRVMLAIIFVTLIIMYLTKEKPSKRQLWVATLLIIACIALVCTDYMSDFLNSFSTESEFGGNSTLTRVLAIEHYWNSPYRSSIFGMGFINDGDYLRYLILHRTNTSMQAYYSDIGLLGLYFNLGIFGIALYVYFLVRLIKSVKLAVKYDKGFEKVLIVGFLIYYLLSSISLLILGASSIFSVPFIWAYIEVYIHKINKYRIDLRK